MQLAEWAFHEIRQQFLPLQGSYVPLIQMRSNLSRSLQACWGVLQGKHQEADALVSVYRTGDDVNSAYNASNGNTASDTK